MRGEAHASPENALEVFLSRTSLELGSRVSHHTSNYPIETPQLSHPPCPMRVYLIKTGVQGVDRDGLSLCIGTVADNVVLGPLIAGRGG